MTSAPLFDPPALVAWAAAVLEHRGVDADKARTVADVLVEGDLLGHDTHGLALLGPNLAKLDDGGLIGRGEVDVLADRPGALLWDGRTLPGPWLTRQAIGAAATRAHANGTAMVVIRRSGHIACLAAYLEAPARDGFIVEIHSSDPSVASVAPYGGTRAVFTPNPIAVGIPTSGDPILIDVSTSITTNAMSARLKAAGQRFPGRWLLDGAGRPTDDPAVFDHDPPGTIQLLGGVESGHKGFGLTLMVEAMTGGLAGYGRPDGVTGWGATVMVRLTAPDLLCGRDAFDRQIDGLARSCAESPAIEPAEPVRLPGHRGLARKRRALAEGLRLNPLVHAAIGRLAEQTGIALPA